MRDPYAVRKLTTLFPVFLGLRLLPMGLWFLSLALPLPGGIPHPLHGALLVAAVGATWWIHRWYREHYGLVEAGRQRFGRSWALFGGLAAAYLVLAGGTGRLETRRLVLVLTLIVLAAGVGWALPRFRTGRRLLVAVGAIAVVAAALLVAMPAEPAGLGAVGWLLSLAIGLVLCAAGWAEHHTLRNAFADGESIDA